MEKSKENVLERQTPETNLSCNGFQFPSPLGLFIKKEFSDPQHEPPLWPSVGFKSERTSPDQEEWQCKTETFQERLLLRNGEISTTLPKSIKEEGNLDDCPVVKKEVLEMDTDVLLTDYNEDLNYPNFVEGYLTGVKGTQPWACGNRNKIDGTPPLYGEPGSLPEIAGLRSVGGVVIDTNKSDEEYQSAKYQPVVRLVRLSDPGPVSLGADVPPVGRGDKRRCITTKNKLQRQKVRRHKRYQRHSQTHIDRCNNIQVGRSDDPQIRRSSVTYNTELYKRESGIYGRPLQKTDQDPETTRTCEDVSDTIPQRNTTLSSKGVQKSLLSFYRRKQGKFKMSTIWASRKFTSQRYRGKQKAGFPCQTGTKSVNTKTGLRLHLLGHSKAKHICKVCGKRFKRGYSLTLHLRTHSGIKALSSDNRLRKHVTGKTCSICCKTFVSSRNLKKHSLVHTDEYPYSCDICHKAFRQRGNLKTHTLIHTGEKPHTCDICQKGFTQKHSLTSHMLLHTGETPYSCDICHKGFRQKGNLQTHMFIHTGKKPHTCEVCHKSFTSADYLKKHHLIHTGEKPHTCQICARSFGQLGSFRRHMLTHKNEKFYTCEICRKTFRDGHYLKAHMLLHTGEKPYTCDICHQSFILNGALKQHILIHTGEKSHSCDICNKGFTGKYKLKIHARIHTGEKPYNCGICNKGFTQRSSLNVHLRIHTGEKPYTCEICHKGFAQSSGLKTHMSMHAGVKPHTCDICHKGYRQKGSLKSHMSKHTDEKQTQL